MAIGIGIGLILMGRYVNGQKRIPDDAIIVLGSVVAVRSQRSSLQRRRSLYGPVIAYDHPLTGRREQLEPNSYYGRRRDIGDTIEVSFSPSTGRAYRAPEYRGEHLIVPGFGVAMILLGIYDWVF